MTENQSEYQGDQTIGNMTLEEVGLHDSEMFNAVIKNAKRYTFVDPNTAIKFVSGCIGATLDYLGIGRATQLPVKVLDEIQRQKGIVIEHRKHFTGEDVWKNGIYIYKKDIMVSFISDIFAPTQNPILVNPVMEQWIVFTNARI